MKSFFRLLLFVSLIFLVGCTITKRRYTGGYYVNWHNKAPDAKAIAQRKTTQPALNKIARPNSSSKKIVIPQKTVNPVNQKLVKVVTGNLQEKLLTNSFLYNLLPKSVSRSNIVAPSDTVTGHHQSEKDTTKRDVRLSWLFCLLGLLFGLIFGVIVALSLAFAPRTQGQTGVLILLLPLLFFILSAVYGLRAIWHDKKLAIALYILVALCTLIDAICSVVIVVEILALLFPHI